MLPDSWVDSLFARLQVRYGDAWTRKWEGLDLVAVKADWAEVLSGYTTKPEAIKHGLQHLPDDRAPNASQFASLCRGTPEVHPKQLRGPASESAVVQAAIAKALAGKKGDEGPRAWANRLRIREQSIATPRLTAAQRAMWCEALQHDKPAEAA